MEPRTLVIPGPPPKFQKYPPEAGDSVSRGHGYNKGEEIVNERVEGLKTR